jgi:hypothetical protein
MTSCESGNTQLMPLFPVLMEKHKQRTLHENGNEALVSGFCCDVDDICALVGYYAASCNNCILTFQDHVSVPSSRIKSPTLDTSWKWCTLEVITLFTFYRGCCLDGIWDVHFSQMLFHVQDMQKADYQNAKYNGLSNDPFWKSLTALNTWEWFMLRMAYNMHCELLTLCKTLPTFCTQKEFISWMNFHVLF